MRRFQKMYSKGSICSRVGRRHAMLGEVVRVDLEDSVEADNNRVKYARAFVKEASQDE